MMIERSRIVVARGIASPGIQVENSRPARRHKRPTAEAGLTIIELLVTLAIVTVLISVLLPAVQSCRETARRCQCRNNLHTIALACLAFESHLNHFPSGGWGWRWVGDPDRGSGIGQPGGWAFSILPFHDDGAIHQLASDGRPEVITVAQRRGAAKAMAALPTGLNCPSRRPSMLLPLHRTMVNGDAPPSMLTSRSDFAINAGDGAAEGPFGPGRGEGPPSSVLAMVDTYPWWWRDNVGRPVTTLFSGISFVRSRIRTRDVTDGLSKTYLVGEKYLNPKDFFTGSDSGDNENFLAGFNNDNSRSTLRPPMPDRSGVAFSDRFGSSHPGSLSMAFADGSVRGVSYDVSAAVHKSSGNRADGF